MTSASERPASQRRNPRHQSILMGAGLAALSWALAALYCALTDRWWAVLACALGALGYVPAIPPTDRARPRVVAIFSATNVVAILGLASQTGGIASPALIVLVPVVLATALLVGGRFALVSGVGALAGAFLLLGAELAGIDVGTGTLLERAAAFPIALVLSIVLGLFAHRAVQGERAMAIARADDAQKSAEALARSRDALEKNALKKSAFYATMSHEIRTPLGGLLGLLTALEGSRLDDEQRDVVGLMHTSAESLRLIVNDMLDLEAIERGALRIEPDRVDPRAVLEDVAALHRGAASARGLRLGVALDGSLPDALVGDGLRLRQIVQNLTSNAMKFTERGEITLAARYEGGALVVEVKDTGPGIPGDRLAAIFLPFEQADPTLARRFGGSGLGLAIVKQLTDAMNGTVTVESELGVGSRFVVRLPLAVATADGHLERAPAGPRRALEAPARFGGTPGRHAGLRALIVDDDRINRIATALVLRRLGVEGVEAESHEAARRALDAGRFDVVFLDQHMPEGLGSELARELLARPDPPFLVMLTASALAEDRAATAAAGVQEFLAKPLDLPALERVLDRVPRDRHTPDIGSLLATEGHTRKRSSDSPSGLQGELDPERIAELRELAGDRIEFAGLMQTFVAQMSDTVSELEVLERAPDAAEVRRIAHRIKGGGANVGARALADAARRVEESLPRSAPAADAGPHARRLIEASRRTLRAIAVLLESG